MNDPTKADRPTAYLTWASVAPWAALAIVLVVEYGLFRQHVIREVAWNIPTYFDQCPYIARSYDHFETILSDGLWTAFRQAWRAGGANGTQLSIQASLLYLLIGPSRLSALTLPFAYFALFQIALVTTVRRLTGRWSAGFLGLGLLLAAKWPFLDAGGIMDFRIDFTASCLFGIFLCAAIRSDLFRSWPWSAATGAVATMMVLFRFVTAPYVVATLGLLFVWLCVEAWRKRAEPAERRTCLVRMGGIAIAGVVFTAVVLPTVLLKWQAIEGYYIALLYNGEKEVRCTEYGYLGLTRLWYYPKSLFLDHAQLPYLTLSGIVLVAALVLAGLRIRRGAGPVGAEHSAVGAPQGLFLLFALLGVLAPVGILTAYGSPSPVVGGVAMGGLIWLTLLVALRILRLPRLGGDRWSSVGLTALACFAMFAGLCVQFKNYGKHRFLPAPRADYEELVRMYDVIGQHAARMKWRTPAIVHSVVADAMNADHIKTVSYEAHGVRVPAHEILARSIAAPSEADALEAIENSVIVVMLDPSSKSVYPYPYNEAMRRMYPKLQAACEVNHFVLERFRIFGDETIVYARAVPQLRGASADGWITSDGLLLSAPGRVLRDRPHIELAGELCWGTPAPKVTATVLVPGKTPRPVQASLASEGDRYRIDVDLKLDEIPDLPQVEIQLDFDRSFVPSELTGSADSRHLVMRSPTETRLLRTTPRTVGATTTSLPR